MTGTTWGALKKQADDATRPLPDDWYRLVCAKATCKTASTGSLMIYCQFKVDDGPQFGKSAFTNLVFSPDNSFALNLFFRKLAAFGFDDQFFRELEAAELDVEDGLQIIAAQLPDRAVKAEIGTRQFQGQDRNEIVSFAAVPGANARPVVDKQLLSGAPAGPPVPGGPVGPPAGPPVPGASSVTRSGPPVPVAPVVSTSPVAPTTPTVGQAPTVGAGPATPSASPVTTPAQPPPVPTF